MLDASNTVQVADDTGIVKAGSGSRAARAPLGSQPLPDVEGANIARPQVALILLRCAFAVLSLQPKGCERFVKLLFWVIVRTGYVELAARL